MGSRDATLWLQPVGDEACGACPPSGPGACGIRAAEGFCAAPALSGDPARAARLLGALREVRDPEQDRNLVDAGLIHSLRIDADEAELALTFAPACGIHKTMAEQAFQVLRRALPDTDVYVRHAA